MKGTPRQSRFSLLFGIPNSPDHKKGMEYPTTLLINKILEERKCGYC